MNKLNITVSVASPSELYESLSAEMATQGIKSNPHIPGDCTLVTTSFLVDGKKAFAVLVHEEKKAYPVLLDEYQLRELARRCVECADELHAEVAQ